MLSIGMNIWILKYYNFFFFFCLIGEIFEISLDGFSFCIISFKQSCFLPKKEIVKLIISLFTVLKSTYHDIGFILSNLDQSPFVEVLGRAMIYLLVSK